MLSVRVSKKPCSRSLQGSDGVVRAIIRAHVLCGSVFCGSALCGSVIACSPNGKGGGANQGPVVLEPAQTAPVVSTPSEDMPTEPAAPTTDMSGGPDLLAGDGDMPAPPPPPSSDPTEVRRGLTAKQVSCPSGQSTTVSGTVYIPSGALPVYNAIVYVPDAQLKPFTDGVSCGCDISGHPIASTLTGADGTFTIENVPVGENIPLVVQVGKWRRLFTLPKVDSCVNTAVPDQTLRLPSTRADGDIPKIGVVTAVNDALECLVRKLGISDDEFTVQSSDRISEGRVQLFAGQAGADHYAPQVGGGKTFPPSGALWDTLDALTPYDLVLLSCDGQRDNVSDKPLEALQAMFDYANMGGRIFASHYQNVWFKQGPDPFPQIASFVDKPVPVGALSASITTTFPKGQAMADWAQVAGALDANGLVDIINGERSIAQENTTYAQRWLSSDAPATVQYISANTPFGASDDKQCGRVVLSDLHVSAGRLPADNPPAGDDFSTPSTPFPEGCVTSGFTPQEKVLAFMLFDLSACVVPDNVAPAPPPIIR